MQPNYCSSSLIPLLREPLLQALRVEDIPADADLWLEKLRREGFDGVVVDDDPDLLRALGLRLRANNYEVTTAADGYSAIASAQ
jgi:CheY-like chemotaxis protein